MPLLSPGDGLEWLFFACLCQRKQEFSARAGCVFKLRLSISLFFLPLWITFFEKNCISSATSFADVALPTLCFFQLSSWGLNFFDTSVLCWKGAGFIQCLVSGSIFLLWWGLDVTGFYTGCLFFSGFLLMECFCQKQGENDHLITFLSHMK